MFEAKISLQIHVIIPILAALELFLLKMSAFCDARQDIVTDGQVVRGGISVT